MNISNFKKILKSILMIIIIPIELPNIGLLLIFSQLNV